MEGSPELALWMEQQKWDPAPQAPSYGTTYSNPADCDADPVPWIVILSSGYNLSWTAMCAQELDATVSSYIAGWTDDYGQPVFIVDYFRV